MKPELAAYSHIVRGDATDLVPLARKIYSGPLKALKTARVLRSGKRLWYIVQLCRGRADLHTRVISGEVWQHYFFQNLLESWADVLNATSLQAGGIGALPS